MNPSFDLGIRAQILLTLKDGEVRPLANQWVGVRDGKIAEVGPYSDAVRARCKRFIDADSHVVMPGLVNAHTHLAMTLFRGLEDELSFHDWLFQRILPLEGRCADRAFVRAGTELALLECVRFGVTTVNEMYFFASEAADAIDRAGVRGVVSQVFAQFPLPEDAALGSDRVARFRDLHSKYSGHERIKVALGPHAPYTCDDAIFREIVRLSEETRAPIHVHVSETAKEVQDSIAQYGKTPPARLAELGVLGERTVAAHGVHLTDADIELFASARAAVVYNPDSNMKLGSGIAPVGRLLDRKVGLALGTDGAASNNNLGLFGAMNVGAKLQKLFGGERHAMTADDAIRAATWGGAHALGLSSKIGSIELGKSADLIAINFAYPHLQPVHSVASQLVYSATGAEVDTVICQGQVLFEKDQYTTLDREKILRDVEIQRARIQKETESLRGMRSTKRVSDE